MKNLFYNNEGRPMLSERMPHSTTATVQDYSLDLQSSRKPDLRAPLFSAVSWIATDDVALTSWSRIVYGFVGLGSHDVEAS